MNSLDIFRYTKDDPNEFDINKPKVDESEKNKYSELEQFIMDEFQWEFKMK